MLRRRRSTTPTERGNPMPPIKTINFWKDKYGPELLIDICRIEAIPNFIIDARPHRLTFYDIAFIDEGAGTYYLDFSPCPVAPRQVLFTSPGQVRQWDVRPGMTGYVLFFTAEFITTFFNDARFLEQLPYFHASTTPLHLEVCPEAFQTLTSNLREAEVEITARHRDQVHMLRAILYQVLIKLSRLYQQAYGVAPAPGPQGLVHRFRRLVEQRFQQVRQVQAFADLLGVSADYLNDCTKEHYGTTASGLIRERILLEARRLLQYTDQTVAEVAYRLNFNDPAYFARFFKRYVGASPTDFRQPISEKYQHSTEM